MQLISKTFGYVFLIKIDAARNLFAVVGFFYSRGKQLRPLTQEDHCNSM